MKRSRSIRIPSNVGLFRVKLLTLCFFFVIGIAAGWAAQHAVRQSDDVMLREYILQYAQYTSANADITASVISVLFAYFRYPIAIFAAGFTAASLFLVPLLVTLQAFSAAFSVACFVSSLGNNGLTLALAAFAVRYLILLPITLLSAISAMCRPTTRVRSQKKPQEHRRDGQSVSTNCFCMLICAAVLLLGAAIELLIVPQLLELALAGIT